MKNPSPAWDKSCHIINHVLSLSFLFFWPNLSLSSLALWVVCTNIIILIRNYTYVFANRTQQPIGWLNKIPRQLKKSILFGFIPDCTPSSSPFFHHSSYHKLRQRREKEKDEFVLTVFLFDRHTILYYSVSSMQRNWMAHQHCDLQIRINGLQTFFLNEVKFRPFGILPIKFHTF